MRYIDIFTNTNDQYVHASICLMLKFQKTNEFKTLHKQYKRENVPCNSYTESKVEKKIKFWDLIKYFSLLVISFKNNIVSLLTGKCKYLIRTFLFLETETKLRAAQIKCVFSLRITTSICNICHSMVGCSVAKKL